MVNLIADIDISRGDLITALVLVLDVVAIASVLMGRGSTGHKVLWTLLIILLPVLGMILYYLIGQSPEDAKLMR